MSNKEKLAARITKLLNLASNNTSAAEAETALLAARKLMAEHGIDESDLEQEKDKVDSEEAMSSGRLNDQKVAIMVVIAHNHRCRLIHKRGYDATTERQVTRLEVVGFARDRALVQALYEWAWRVVAEQADKFVSDLRKKRDLNRSELLTVRRSYILGFANGMQEAYDSQITANPQWALVLSTPAEVEDFMEEATKGRQAAPSKHSGLDSKSFLAGADAGLDHAKATSQKETAKLVDDLGVKMLPEKQDVCPVCGGKGKYTDLVSGVGDMAEFYCSSCPAGPAAKKNDNLEAA